MLKSIRWYQKVATLVLFDTSVVNVWIVYNINKPSNKKKAITKFCETQVNELLELDQSHTEIYYKSLSTSTKPKTKHTFEETVESDNRNQKGRKRCIRCYTLIAVD